jgi:hypothetical protein
VDLIDSGFSPLGVSGVDSSNFYFTLMLDNFVFIWY